MANLPERIQVNLPLEWTVTFGTTQNAANEDLTSRMMCITSQVDQIGKLYVRPWQIRLEKAMLRAGDDGDCAATVYGIEDTWADKRIIPEPPL
jgi:hypothetical protein